MSVDRRDVVGDGVAGSINMALVETDRNTDDTDDEFADQHAQGTPDQQWTTTEFLDGVERERSRADVDAVEDQRDQERVGDGSGGLQERSRVVEDEVDTGPIEMVSRWQTKDQASLTIAASSAKKYRGWYGAGWTSGGQDRP